MTHDKTCELFRHLNQRDAGHPVFLRGSQALDAGAVRSEAERIYALLRSESTPVFLYFEDAGNFLAAFWGALTAGREVLLPGHAAPGFLQEIGATGQKLITDVTELDGKAVLSQVQLAAKAGPELPPITDGHIGFFTSGSTGEPKLCRKVPGQLVGETAMQLELWGAPKGPVVGTVSHQHIYGLLFRVLWPLAAGQIYVAQRQDTWEAVAHHLQAGSPLISSPAHLSRIPEAFSLAAAPEIIFSSGGPLLFQSAAEAKERLGCQPVEVLGSTETGGVAWRRQTTIGSAWTPFADVEVTTDAEGVLMVRSPFTGTTGFVWMGDGVSLLPDGRFELHARLDRVVKVEGKRVSLPRVEEVLRTVQGVRDAAVVDLPDRFGALGAVVALDNEARAELERTGRFRYSRRIRRALAERLEPMERPRFWRFVDTIPQNAQGKRIVGDLRALFRDRPEMPKVQRREVSGDKARVDMELTPDLRWFDGHFPEQPILPGVAQLHIAASMAADIWGGLATGREMSRIKFRRVMRPGDVVTLTLSRNGADRLDFQYLSDGEVLASGAIQGYET